MPGVGTEEKLYEQSIFWLIKGLSNKKCCAFEGLGNNCLIIFKKWVRVNAEKKLRRIFSPRRTCVHCELCSSVGDVQ